MNANVNRVLWLAAAFCCLCVLDEGQAQSKSTPYCPRCKYYVDLPHSAESCEVYRSLGKGAPPPSAGTSRNQNLQQQLQGAQQLGTALGSLFESIARSREARKPAPDLNRLNTPADPPQVIAPPAPDPRKVEERKRLEQIKSMGLDKVSWDDAVNAYRKQLPPEQQKTFDSNLKQLTGKDDWDSFQAPQSGAATPSGAAKTQGTENQQATRLSEYKTRQQTLDEWNNFTTDNAKPANGDAKTPDSRGDGGVLKWKNGPIRKAGESDVEYRRRLREWKDNELHEETVKEVHEEFYQNIEKGRFPKANDSK